MRHPLKRSVLFALAAALPFALHAEPDLERGKQLHRQCALCHGQYSQGILGGKYPRMAGLPEYYLIKMIERYKSGELNYPAMTVVGGLRNLSQADIESLVAYISLIDLGEVAPLDIPTAPGDVEEGEEMYKNDCRSCHGRKGEGNSRKESPPLRGQYTEYLAGQIEMFKRKQREHALDPEDETFVDYSDEELRDILAYISTLDDN